MIISRLTTLTMFAAASLLLASCSTYTHGTTDADAQTSADSAQSEGMSAEACKTMMQNMHKKMTAEGMDMAAMKEKMKSGEGMSDAQKQCHTLMHSKMKDSDE